MKRVLLAMVVLATTVLATAGPSSAATTVVIDGVKVSLQTDGDLSVTGTNGNDLVELVTNPTDSTMTDVWVGETLAMTAALNDATISLGAGDDIAVVRASDATYTLSEDGSSTSTPGNPNSVSISGRLSIKVGGDNDFAAVLAAEVAGNTTVAMGAADLGPIDGRRDNDGAVLIEMQSPGNLTMTGLANVQSLTTINLSIGGQTTFDLGQGDNNATDITSTYNRLAWNSGGGEDRFTSIQSDIGNAPTFRTAGGDDLISLFSSPHSGKAVFNTGSGDDEIQVGGHFFANMGDGNDSLRLDAGVTPDSVADGGPGDEDRILSGFGPPNLVIKGFEIIN